MWIFITDETYRLFDLLSREQKEFHLLPQTPRRRCRSFPINVMGEPIWKQSRKSNVSS
jgi:hypothetical protein